MDKAEEKRLKVLERRLDKVKATLNQAKARLSKEIFDDARGFLVGSREIDNIGAINSLNDVIRSLRKEVSPHQKWHDLDYIDILEAQEKKINLAGSRVGEGQLDYAIEGLFDVVHSLKDGLDKYKNNIKKYIKGNIKEKSHYLQQ